jgi:hypothetical protein
MSVLARTRSAISRRSKLVATAALLSAAVVVMIQVPLPASADSSGFTPLFLGTYSIQSYQTGLCLYQDIIGVSTYNPPCDEADEMWSAVTDPYGGFNLVNESTGNCLDGNYSNVYWSPCNWNDTYQNWTVGGQGPAATIQNGQTQYCLDGNYNYNVYTSPCNWNNTFQNWNIDFQNWDLPPN